MTPEEKAKRLRYLQLKAKAGQGEVTIPEQPAAKEGPGAWRSGALGVAQGGTFGTSDEIGGLAGKLLIGEGVRLPPGVREQMAAAGIEAPPDRSTYEITRDLMRGENKQAQAEHPYAYGGGELAGAAATALVLPGSQAKTVGGLLKTGAKLGAAYGAGTSEADLSKGEVGRFALDVGKGAGLGAVGSGVGAAAGKLVSPAARLLQAAGLRQGRRVLLSGADQLSTRSQVSDEAVREAIKSGAIRPLSTTQKAWERLEGQTGALGKAYADIVERLEQMGVTGPDAQDLAEQLLRRRGEEWARTGADKAVPRLFRAEAQNLERIAAPSTRLGLGQAEAVKRDLQRRARLDHLNRKPTDEATGEIASMMRQAVEDSIDDAAKAAGPGSEVAELAANFVPVKQRLGRLIEARNAAERGAARASQRTTSAVIPDRMTLATSLAAGDPSVLAAPLLAQASKNRLPSALAWALRGGGEKMQQLAARNPAALVRGAASAGSVGERALLDEETRAIIDYLRKGK